MKKVLRNLGLVLVISVALIASSNAQTKEQKETMKKIEAKLGFVPNLLVEMSKSPVAPIVYVESDLIMHEGLLTQKEQQVVQLATSVFNHCAYCTSMHSKFSEINGVSHEDVLAIRNGGNPKEKRVSDLLWVTNTVLENKGHLSEKELQIIEDMGIDRGRLYEVLTHIGRKTMVNYAAHIVNPVIDDEFKFVE